MPASLDLCSRFSFTCYLTLFFPCSNSVICNKKPCSGAMWDRWFLALVLQSGPVGYVKRIAHRKFSWLSLSAPCRIIGLELLVSYTYTQGLTSRLCHRLATGYKQYQPRTDCPNVRPGNSHQCNLNFLTPTTGWHEIFSKIWRLYKQVHWSKRQIQWRGWLSLVCWIKFNLIWNFLSKFPLVLLGN